jgi:hypothetical protein
MAVGGRDDDHPCTGDADRARLFGRSGAKAGRREGDRSQEGCTQEATSSKKGAGKKGAGKKGAGKKRAGSERSSR